VGVPWLDYLCQGVIGFLLVCLALWLLFDPDRLKGWREDDDGSPPQPQGKQE
jgi:hypothetical protein